MCTSKGNENRKNNSACGILAIDPQDATANVLYAMVYLQRTDGGVTFTLMTGCPSNVRRAAFMLMDYVCSQHHRNF